MNAIDGFGHGDCAEGRELLTVNEVGAILSVSKMTVYRMIHAGQLDHVRMEGSYRVIRESLCRYMRHSAGSFGDVVWRGAVESEALRRVRVERI